jgi:DNA topoisomerase-1
MRLIGMAAHAPAQMMTAALPRPGNGAGTPDPQESAQEAGLRYVSDERPGIRRRRAGKGFRYLRPDGSAVRDEPTIHRIAALVIPPAWTDVWISTDPRGHIQATGRDAKGRKQYRYHARWHAVRDETKYERMLAFGAALPTIRARVDADLRRHGLPREKVLATVVNLLEATLIRVGNEEYARENRSYGLTTLRNRHVDVDGAELRFEFRGKSGKEHQVSVRDRRLARVIRRLQELPGQEVFQYLDEDGDRKTVDSDDVNEYLRAISGQDLTAKDFRTWAGTVLCAVALREVEACDTETEAKRNVVEVVKTVSRQLGNTPAVCRSCYIHPAVIESYFESYGHAPLAKALGKRLTEAAEHTDTGLTDDESAVLRLLRRRLGEEHPC